MLSRVTLLVLAGFVPLSTMAQSDSTSRPIHGFIALYGGALFPQVGETTTITTSLVPGVRFNRIALGVGVGYDTYDYWETLPIFATVSYDVLRPAKGALFLQLDGGYAKAWARQSNLIDGISELEGGYTFHPIIGYRMHYEKLTFYLSAGYKIQRLSYSFGSPAAATTWAWGWSTTVTQDIERLSIQVGIGMF